MINVNRLLNNIALSMRIERRSRVDDAWHTPLIGAWPNRQLVPGVSDRDVNNFRFVRPGQKSRTRSL